MIEYDEIISIEEIEEDECYDIMLLENNVYLNEPNFIANGFVVHNCGMDATYCKRKNGEEEYFIHPLLEPFLKDTYGVMAYQEQILKALHVVGLIPLEHCEKVRKAISKKKFETIKKYHEMFLINGQKTLNANLDFVEALFDQIAAFAEYGFNLSHATAYTYISSSLLWLKAHYPLEFYTAILMCEKDADKFKDYCVDAASHGVIVKPVDINKSDKNFKIVGDEIYFGFSNIKGIGKEDAKKIVSQQPYKSFVDFVERFGPSIKVLKPLISIGVFDELEPKHDHLTLFKFAVFYQKLKQSRAGTKKRYKEALIRQKSELRELLLTQIPETDPDFEKMAEFTQEAVALWQKYNTLMLDEPFNYKGEQRTRKKSFTSMLEKILGKRQSSIKNFKAKEEDYKLDDFNLSNFNASKIKVDKKIESLFANFVTHKGRRYYPLAESQFYGFQWSSNIERSPLYKGYTFDCYSATIQQDKAPFAYIEVEIKAVRKRISKNQVEFYSVEVEDANGKTGVVNVWLDDYLRFSDELKKGNLVRMEVKPPTGGFKTYSFNSVQKRFRHKLPKNKEDDLRLIVLPESNEDPRVDLTGLVMED